MAAKKTAAKKAPAKKVARKAAPAAKKAPAKKTTAKGAVQTFSSREDMDNWIRGSTIQPEKDRLSARPRPVAPADTPKPAEPRQEGSVGGWGDKPTVADQLAKYPETVRTKSILTEILKLSDPKHLERWNELQNMQLPTSAPRVRIADVERLGLPTGHFVVYVTFHTLEYQQL